MEISYMDIDCLMNMDKIEHYKQLFSEYRIAKIDKCKLVKNKAQSLGAGYLMSILLQNRGIDEKTVCYLENEHGKPFLKDYTDIHFSVSHSDHIVAVIFDEKPCGIDVEKIKNYSQSVVNRIFCEQDKKLMEQAAESSYDEAAKLFAKIWTRKEAIGKLSGKGLDFTDELQKNELNHEYLGLQGIYGFTYDAEADFVISAFSSNPDIKGIIPIKREFETI